MTGSDLKENRRPTDPRFSLTRFFCSDHAFVSISVPNLVRTIIGKPVSFGVPFEVSVTSSLVCFHTEDSLYQVTYGVSLLDGVDHLGETGEATPISVLWDSVGDGRVFSSSVLSKESPFGRRSRTLLQFSG